MDKALTLEGPLLRRLVLALAALACAVLGLTTLPAPAAQADTTDTATVVGRVVDGTGAAVAAKVVVLVNRDGGLVPESDPVDTVNGAYTVTAPAGEEVAILAQLPSGPQAWLSGGGVSEPNEYLYLTAGEVRQVQDINTGGGRLSATAAPRVRGVAANGHTLATTRGAWNASPSSYRFQWLRNGHLIRGASGATYRVSKYDVRRVISVRVVALRSGFSSGAAYSGRLAVRH